MTSDKKKKIILILVLVLVMIVVGMSLKRCSNSVETQNTSIKTDKTTEKAKKKKLLKK